MLSDDEAAGRGPRTGSSFRAGRPGAGNCSGWWCSSTRRQGKAFDFGDGVVGGVDLGELANVFAHVGVLEQEIGRVLDRLRLWGRGPQVDAESVVLDAGGVGGLVFSLAGDDGRHPGREGLVKAAGPAVGDEDRGPGEQLLERDELGD